MNITDAVDELKIIVQSRLKSRMSAKLITTMYNYGIREIRVAGNSLNSGEPNDIDIYPIHKEAFDNIALDVEPVSETKNAVTYIIDNTTVQFCKYFKPTLDELVDSFDFAHVKLGLTALLNSHGTLSVDSVYFSDDYLQYLILNNTFYTGSEYPLSSLIRLVKYAKRGNFARNSYYADIILILIDIIKRGFTSKEDFRDQLDAIDLGLLDDVEDRTNRLDKDLLYELCDLLLARNNNEEDNESKHDNYLY